MRIDFFGERRHCRKTSAGKKDKQRSDDSLVLWHLKNLVEGDQR